MKRPVQYRLVKAAYIDLTDKSYALNPFPEKTPDKNLVLSIEQFGILHPPLLLEVDDNNFIVLSGRQRILIEAKQPETVITALVIGQEYTNHHQVIFSTLLQHQLIGSDLTLIEQAVLLEKATALLPAEQVINLLPPLGYKAKTHIRADLISLLSLSTPAQLAVHSGQLSLRNAKRLLKFSPADQAAITELITQLKLGGSKQQKLLDYIVELTKRLQVSGTELLNNWQEEEKDKQHNGPQMAASLLNWLQHKCSPRLTAEKKNFKRFCRKLELPPGVSVSHTLSFEDERVSLTVDFSSRKKLMEKLPQIKAILMEDNS